MLSKNGPIKESQIRYNFQKKCISCSENQICLSIQCRPSAAFSGFHYLQNNPFTAYMSQTSRKKIAVNPYSGYDFV